MSIKPGGGFFPIITPILFISPLLYLRDPFVMLLFSALSLLLLMSFVQALYINKKTCYIEGETLGKSTKCLVTEKFMEKFIFNNCGNIFEVQAPSWAHVESIENFEKSTTITLSFSFPSPGKYVLGSVRLFRHSSMDIFKVEKDVAIKRSFKVLPESSIWIIRGLRFLGIGAHGLIESGRETNEISYEMGEATQSISSLFKHRSGEFLGIRHMLPEDDQRMIEWKASLRSLRLSVKEFSSGGERLEPFVIADYRCYGPRSCDAVASSLISIALFLAEEGYSMPTLEEVESKRIVKFSDGRTMLAYLIDRVLEENLAYIDESDLYEITAPLSINEIRGALAKLYGENMLELTGISSQYKEELKTSPVIVTSLIHDPATPIDIASESSSQGLVASIIVPSEPWKDTQDLERAYAIRRTYELLLNKLKTAGGRVIEWRR